MNNPCVLHEDTFYEYFKPRRLREAQYDIWGGHGLETFENTSIRFAVKIPPLCGPSSRGNPVVINGSLQAIIT